MNDLTLVIGNGSCFYLTTRTFCRTSRSHLPSRVEIDDSSFRGVDIRLLCLARTQVNSGLQSCPDTRSLKNLKFELEQKNRTMQQVLCTDPPSVNSPIECPMLDIETDLYHHRTHLLTHAYTCTYA